VYARRQCLSEECKAEADRIRVYALEKLGHVLGDMEKNAGGRPAEKPVRHDDRFPTLEELDITKNASSLAQRLAKLAPETVESIAAGEISVSRAVKESAEPRKPKKRPDRR